jgi:hypothetical protein
VSPDQESARLLGQYCANAVLDSRSADPADELRAVGTLLSHCDRDPDIAVSECTYQTLFGYYETLTDYVQERADV